MTRTCCGARSAAVGPWPSHPPGRRPPRRLASCLKVEFVASSRLKSFNQMAALAPVDMPAAFVRRLQRKQKQQERPPVRWAGPPCAPPLPCPLSLPSLLAADQTAAAFGAGGVRQRRAGDAAARTRRQRCRPIPAQAPPIHPTADSLVSRCPSTRRAGAPSLPRAALGGAGRSFFP